jgi:hypothetical protein
MIKRIKLIFYISSAVVLGLLTIWQIYSVRGVLASTSGKELDAELSQVQDVVRLWKKRQPFNGNGIEKTATPSGARVTPTTRPTVVTPTVAEDEEATVSAEN